MYGFVLTLHIFLCIGLILIILLQPGKGGDIGAAFGGGGSSSLFGARGPASMLQRMTTGVAVTFMFTSITLALYSRPDARQEIDVDADIEELQREAAQTQEQITTPAGEQGGEDAQE